jgi:Tfp pilus assembly protein PilF
VGHSYVGWVPREILERPVPLRRGVGTFHEEVTTSSIKAQAFYDQGLAYLHSYVWIEAARSFHQALRLDAKLTMAYVGLSYAYSSMDYASARAELERAQNLAVNLSDRERRRIQIRAIQLEAMTDPQDSGKYLAYRHAIDEALAAYPDDVELLLLRGNAEEPSAFGDGQGCVLASIPFYEKALVLSPDDFAAHHYLTHCYENAGRVQEALEHGKEYARLSPAIPHAQHMYGHDLRRVGRIEEAIGQFLRADALERAYYRSENIAPALDWHHAHNLSLLASSYQYLGQMLNAERIFREIGSLPAYTDYAAFNRKDWPEFLLDRGRFREALQASRAMISGGGPLARVAGHALAGSALLAMNQLKEATTELADGQREMQSLQQGDAGAVLPYIETLRAEILLSAGRATEARPVLEGVERWIRAANGPDAWSQGLFRLEFVARFAGRVGDWGASEELSRLMLDRAPFYAGSHYALALVAKHNGDADGAHSEFAAAEKFWSKADPKLPELSKLRQELALLRPTKN